MQFSPASYCYLNSLQSRRIWYNWYIFGQRTKGLCLTPIPIIKTIHYLVLKVLAVGSSFQYTFGCGQAIVTNFFTISGY